VPAAQQAVLRQVQIGAKLRYPIRSTNGKHVTCSTASNFYRTVRLDQIQATEDNFQLYDIFPSKTSIIEGNWLQGYFAYNAEVCR